jgi:long-chain fatty acid transport protein
MSDNYLPHSPAALPDGTELALLPHREDGAMNTRIINPVIVAAGLASLVPASALAVGAGGFTTQLASARALGRANAFVAQVNDATAVTFNPAALTEIRGTEITAGITPLNPTMKYSSPWGTQDLAVRNVSVIPNFFAASKLGQESWAFGIGVTVPYGGSTEWRDRSQLRYVTTRSNLQVVNVEPTVALRLSPKLSLGLGLDYFYSPKLEQARMVNAQLLDGPGAPDGVSVIDASGDGWGLSLGALWKPGKRHRIGLSYRSPVTVDYEGTMTLADLSGTMAAVFGGTSYTTGGQGKLTYPASVTVGYGFQATPRWAMELDLEWTGWSSFDEVMLEFEETDPLRLSILNAGNPTPKNWKDVFSASIGTEYELATRVFVRGGYYYFDNPVPNSTFDPSLPDSDVHGLTLGLGLPVGPLDLDLAYKSYFFETRNVDNGVGDDSGGPVDGTYRTSANTFALSLTARF